MKHWEHLCLLWDAVSWEGRSCQDIFMVSLSSFNDVGNDWRLRLQLVLQAKLLTSVKEELLRQEGKGHNYREKPGEKIGIH